MLRHLLDDGGFELGQDIVQQVLEKGPFVRWLEAGSQLRRL